MKNILIIISVFICLLSCRSYKEIHALAESSSEKLDLFKEINYNFSVHCQNKCYFRALENTNFTLDFPECDCREELKTDRNFNKLISGLVKYFKALEGLSENKLTSLSLKPLAEPFVDAEYISKSELKPLQNLSEHIGQMIQNKYRSKQLGIAIEKAHSPVVEILENLQEVINENLLLTLENQKGELQQIYLINFKDSLNTNYNRFQIKDDFYNKLTEIANIEQSLTKYSKVLDKVKKAHELLYKNRNRIDLQRTKDELLIFYGELEDLLN